MNNSTFVAIGAGAATTVALSISAYALLKGSTSSPTLAPRKLKNVSDSSVNYACKISPEVSATRKLLPELALTRLMQYCDEHGRVYGGELLKMIDVSAGIVAAKHAGGPCLTVSLE